MNDDIQQERRVRQQHRTESLKALNDGISIRRYVCQYYIHYLFTTTNQPEILDYVNNIIYISGTSQLIRTKEYHVPGIKKKKTERKKKKIEK